MASLVRALVSGNRVRLTKEGYDLDMCYITPRIIAMGYPASGMESQYRNPISEVTRYLTQFHASHYKIWNLAERPYPASEPLLTAAVSAGWPDHHAPPLALLWATCADMHAWLNADEANVAVVHCMAGKGRTGTLIAAYLVWSGACLWRPIAWPEDTPATEPESDSDEPDDLLNTSPADALDSPAAAADRALRGFLLRRREGVGQPGQRRAVVFLAGVVHALLLSAQRRAAEAAEDGILPGSQECAHEWSSAALRAHARLTRKEFRSMLCAVWRHSQLPRLPTPTIRLKSISLHGVPANDTGKFAARLVVSSVPSEAEPARLYYNSAWTEEDAAVPAPTWSRGCRVPAVDTDLDSYDIVLSHAVEPALALDMSHDVFVRCLHAQNGWEAFRFTLHTAFLVGDHLPGILRLALSDLDMHKRKRNIGRLPPSFIVDCMYDVISWQSVPGAKPAVLPAVWASVAPGAAVRSQSGRDEAAAAAWAEVGMMADSTEEEAPCEELDALLSVPRSAIDSHGNVVAAQPSDGPHASGSAAAATPAQPTTPTPSAGPAKLAGAATIHAGWMKKEGGIRKNWTRRYCVLSGGSLKYYKQKDASAPAGVVELGQAIAVRALPSGELPGHPHALHIITPKRTYIFSAESAAEQEAWIIALASVHGRLAMEAAGF